MDDEHSYHLRCGIRLPTGRTITLRRIDQTMTYWGLLEGVPSERINDSIIEAALQDARSVYAWSGEPHLIAPGRRDYHREPGDMDRIRQRSSRLPEWLPMVRCLAVFGSISPVRDRSLDISTLTLVWFQDEYAMPIHAEVLRFIKNVNWDSLAIDTEIG